MQKERLGLENPEKKARLAEVGRVAGFIACLGANIYFVRSGMPALVQHAFEGGINASDAVTLGELAGTGLAANALMGRDYLSNAIKGNVSWSDQGQVEAEQTTPNHNPNS